MAPETTFRGASREMAGLLAAARPDDLFVRWRIDEYVHDAVVDGDHVAWLRTREYGVPAAEVWATALGGDPSRIAALVDDLVRRHDVQGLTVEQDVLEELPDHLRPPEHGHWSYWTIDPGNVSAAAVRAVEIDPADPRIDKVLAHSSSAEMFAGDPRVRRWAGVQDGAALLAVGAEQRRHNDAAHILSVCTVPGARGQGLAYDTCLLLMQAARDDGVPFIFLEMYAANEPARRVYERLGFAEVGRFRSGRLPT